MFGSRAAWFAAAVIITLAPIGHARAENNETWLALKSNFFGDREIRDAGSALVVDGPTRAQDAGMVPIDIQYSAPQTADRYIRTITLIVDHNPSPVAAVFHLTPENGLASVSTRIRINEYSDVRAIAETNTGELMMASRYIKATGGCSAPASKNEELSLAEMGKMLLRQTPVKGASPGAEPIVEAQLHIRHPSRSGMQMALQGNYVIPEHYLKTIEVKRGEQPVITIDGSIAFSEDPMFKFEVKAKAGDRLAVTASDSKGNVFEKAWPVQMQTADSTTAAQQGAEGL